MSEVNIKFRKNASRGNTFPGECINLWSPLNPGGAKGVRFGTNAQGGDGSLEFSIADRGPEGNWPAKKNDAAEVYYSLERVTQHSVATVKRNEEEGVLEYGGQGHDPHYETLNVLYDGGTEVDRSISNRVLLIVYDGTYGWISLSVPFLNNSQRYVETMQAAENPTPHFGYSISATSGQYFEDLLKYCDWERGIWPGKEASPNALGCFFYWRHRTRDKKVKWYITKEDLAAIAGGGFKVTYDWSNYCNWVIVHFKDSAGAKQWRVKEDIASQAKYTPGSQERAVLDLTGIEGYLPNAIADQIGQTYLDLYSEPVPKGSIVVPLKNIQRTGGGMQWAGLIRGGDVVKVERSEFRAFDEDDPIDNFNAFLVDSTLADVDEGAVELFMLEPDDMETMLLDLKTEG